MDKIKYRTWNKEENRWATHNEQLSEVSVSDSVSPPSILTIGEDKYELQMFTGLKDKNGEEVFEGDILKITCNFELRKGIEIDEVVWWENGAWCCSDWCLFELISKEQEFEIIGNKYENQELLKK